MRRRAVRVLVPGLLGGHVAECTDAFAAKDRGRSATDAVIGPPDAARSGSRIRPYNDAVADSPDGADWIALARDAAADRGRGGVGDDARAPARSSSFLGVVRDHADGRDGVVGLGYEAYEDEAAAACSPRSSAEARRRWPDGRPGRAAAPDRRRSRSRSASVAVVVSSPAPRRGVRGGAVLHRHAEGDASRSGSGSTGPTDRTGRAASSPSGRCAATEPVPSLRATRRSRAWSS